MEHIERTTNFFGGILNKIIPPMEDADCMEATYARIVPYDELPEGSIRFSPKVLDQFRTSVGYYRAETGGMLACSNDPQCVDAFYFDKKSKNTSASYSYDVEDMSAAFRKWKGMGFRSVGFVHSHPQNYIRPSFDDIATGHSLMKFFENDFFYLPILMPKKSGLFTLYLYVIRITGSHLNVNLDYVIQADRNGYSLPHFNKWEKDYSVQEVEAYYQRANAEECTEYTAHQDYNTVFVPGVKNYTDVGNYFMRTHLRYALSKELLACFDVEKLGRYYAQVHHGRFVANGFLCNQSTATGVGTND